jgi:hypothetical protein
MTQRLKPGDKNDTEGLEMLKANLVLCHEILVYAMKAKQSADLDTVKKLKTAVVYFKTAYIKSQKH